MATTILLIEDDRNISELLQLYLEKEGYAVATAADGRQGLEQFHSFNPDLVLLDVMMPVMNGWDTCRAIRAESQTPIIMLTAKSETDEYFEYVVRISKPCSKTITTQVVDV